MQPYLGRLAVIANVQTEIQDSDESRSELDNHANMAVVGSECVVFDDTSKTCTVNSFAKSAGSLDDVKIVDAVVAYDYPYQNKTFILLMRNVLHVHELCINIIPPFIMREGGITVDECPKYQAQAPSVSHHSMHSKESNLRIHFDLNGNFSLFKTRDPSDEELGSCDKIFITPSSASWNPYSEYFPRNEQTMLDYDDGLATPTYK